MPTKKNNAGKMQNYVPAGNSAGGQYGDNETGSNKHYFAHFAKQPTMQVSEESKDKISINDIDKEIEDMDFKKFEKELDKMLKDEDIFDSETGELLNDDYDKEIETVDKPVKEINKSVKKAVGKMDDTDCYDYLLGFEGDFDENKLKNLSSQDLHNLVLAKQNLEQAKNKDFFKTINSNLHKELIDYELGSGDPGSIKIWGKAPKNYEDLMQSIPSKEKYYNGIIDAYSTFDDPKEWQTTTYQNALKGKEALDKIKNEIIPEYEKQLDEAKKKKEEYDSIIDESKSLVDKYSNPDSVYSQSAKDKALWFKSYDAASEHLAPIAKETYKEINPSDLDKIKYYTQSYSFINEPLRNKKYSGGFDKKKMFVDYVKGMTNAIDKSVLKENMWVQRGVSTLNINGKDISSYNPEDLQNVVFEDQGFLSCGAAKGTGLTGNNTIMNIYCPKGTKTLYVDPISHYKGHENEMIIQRGYSFKITKVEKKGYKTYLDCEVILNSDIKKYDDAKLKQLQENNFY